MEIGFGLGFGLGLVPRAAWHPDPTRSRLLLGAERTACHAEGYDTTAYLLFRCPLSSYTHGQERCSGACEVSPLSRSIRNNSYREPICRCECHRLRCILVQHILMQRVRV